MAAILVATAIPAHAYIDPGAGSMLVQLVAGGVAGLLILGRLYWRRLKDKITGRPTAVDPAPSRDVAAMAPEDRK